MTFYIKYSVSFEPAELEALLEYATKRGYVGTQDQVVTNILTQMGMNVVQTAIQEKVKE